MSFPAYSPWRAITLIPSQDWPRRTPQTAERDLRNGKRRGATVAATEMWRRAAVLRRVFPDSKYRVVHSAGRSAALAYARHVYRTIGAGQERLHGAVPSVSDERTLVWARVQDRDEPRVTIDEIAVHFTPSAFSNRFSGSKKQQVRAAWDEGRQRLMERVLRNIAEDVPTRISGDFNHKGRSLGTSINGQRVRYVSNGIDKLITVDSPTRKWEHRVGLRIIFNLLSDHHGLSARMRVKVTGPRRSA